MTKYYAIVASVLIPHAETQYDKKTIKARFSGNTIHDAMRKCADEIFKQYGNLDIRNIQINITSEDAIFECYGTA